MLFGNREFMTDVRCPAINVIRNREKWTTSGTYLNGGGFARGSSYSHATYTIAWNLMSPDEARKILDFYNGNYGQGPIYFLDDFALQGNVLPLHWSVPRLTAKDAPPLVKGVVVSETPLAQTNNAGNYPSASATFAWTGTPNSDSVWIPVPAGQNFYFGVRGSRTGTAEITMTRDRSGDTTYTNLLTNPSMETTSGTVEVRRNYALNPMATGTGVGFASYNAGPGEDGTSTFLAGQTDGPTPQIKSYARRSVTAIPTSGSTGWTGLSSANRAPKSGVAGDKEHASVWVRYTGPGTLSGKMRIALYSATAVVDNIDSATYTLPSGEWVNVESSVVATGAYASVGWWFYQSNVQIAPIGSTLDATGLMIGDGEVFDGSFSPDTDLTPSWTGTANASASRLTAPGVVGVSTGFPERAARFSSTQWSASGTRSVRVSPRQTTGSAPQSYASVTLPTLTIGQVYTVLGTVRLAAPQTGTLSEAAYAPARGFWITGAATSGEGLPVYTSRAPNTVGAHQVRATFTANSTVGEVRLMNGALPGGGDVWWDDVMLVEGVFTGPYFDGNTPNSSDWILAWNGAANASTSRAFRPTYWGMGEPMSTSTTQRTNAVFTDPGGITLTVTGSGSLTLNSMYGYIGSEPPPDGNFRSGEGHTGVQFDGVPQRTGYSAVIGEGLEAVSAAFKEVGAWR